MALKSASQDAMDTSSSSGMTEARQNEGRSQQSEQAHAAPRAMQQENIVCPAGISQQIHGNIIVNSKVRQSSGTLPQPPPNTKVAAKEPQGVRTMLATGSTQRKRSRVMEEGGQGTLHLTTKIHEHINNMNLHIENLQKNGQKGNTGTVRTQMYECMKEIAVEVTNILARIVNLQEVQCNYMKAEKQAKDKVTVLQEENNNVKQQVIDLQTRFLQKEQEEKNGMPQSYVQVASKQMANNIINGRQMPLPQVSQSIKQAPSECIIIFKANEKGEMVTKQEQEKFRKVLREALGDERMRGISAIRPTRFGGYTVILQNETIRNEIYGRLRRDERLKELCEDESCMVAPVRRVAKVVCKEAPKDISLEQIKVDMFGKHNPVLQMVNPVHRTGKIYRTRLGLIFEFSSQEMAAVQSQGWRIRCDVARELRVEEFISLQQCYACSKFGHSASECKSEDAVCRLCGKTGHAGKDCPDRDNKELWRCANCKRMNRTKNLQLDEHHAAAQLHKCPVAQQQRNVRKIQLAATGVFTTPIQKGEEILREKPSEASGKPKANGAQVETTQQDSRRRNRSRSIRRFNGGRSNDTQTSTISGRRERVGITLRREGNKEAEENPCVQRAIKVPKPQYEDGWQTVGRKGNMQRESSGEVRESLSEEMMVEEEEELEELRPREELMQSEDE